MSSIPVVTRNLLIINILVWLAQFLLGRVIEIDKYLALHFFESDLFMPHQIITYMFLHDPSSPAHLFFNMFAVYMFGRTLEMVWGPKRFLVYYLLTGIGAAVAQELVYAIEYREIVFNSAIINVNIGEQIINKQDFYNILPPTLGASGAVFGILVAFGMLFPNVELMMVFLPIPIKAKWFVIGYGVMELFLGIADSAGDNVAHFAHLGGLITGFFIILYWRKKGKANGHNFREY
ncbi:MULTISPECIES: rhomboid family intramembrane serine protease [Dysgonomonas]|uniref:rhomboid family intramembrane serine protease n=1 Tax=Dysgonomonas TaxID=156973 RepID=UPI00092A656E|nr:MULTISPECIES: rhomboid family intramembrane serine protease [Dysgonomonas]MBN9302731.1 rhomboid family intramembrane serine protease [Dysgonomonas mossii]OJX59824.1 MAG: rhomboid family intramembrane serine protease [Dysgonomonas sp. 37-18]